MANNDPQEHIKLALGHLAAGTSDDYQPDTVHCQRAQAEAQIAIAMLLSGIGRQLIEMNNKLLRIWERIGD